MRPPRSSERPGFTLLELIIVIGIIALLGTIGFVAFGAIRQSQDQRNTRAALEVARSMYNSFINSARSGGNSLTVDATGASTTFYLKLAPPTWAFNTAAYSSSGPFPVPGVVPDKVDFRERKINSSTPFALGYEKTIDYYNVPRREDDKPNNPTTPSVGRPIPMNVPTVPVGDPSTWVADQYDKDRWQLYATMLTIRRLRSNPEGKAIWSTLRESQIKNVNNVPGQDFIIDAWGNPLLFVPGSGLRGVRYGTGEYTDSGTMPSYVKGDTSSTPLELQGIRSPDGKAFWMSAGPDGYYDTQDDNLYSFNN